MISLAPGTKVFLACRPVDLRNGFDGLAAKAQQIIGADPFSGHLFLFRGKRGDYLKALFANVVVQDKSARESLTTFASGKGDVLLGYENEAIFARRQGQPLEYVVPDQTILIENPAAITEDANGAAKGFLDFLVTEEAQKVFGGQGYRPVVKSVLDTFDFPTPPGLFTIADVGGWETVQREFFDREKGFMADVQRELGQPTE